MEARILPNLALLGDYQIVESMLPEHHVDEKVPVLVHEILEGVLPGRMQLTVKMAAAKISAFPLIPLDKNKSIAH